MEDKELYYDLSKFAANMMADRNNFMLVFQSILFATVVTVSNNGDIPIYQLIAFCAVGLCSSLGNV